MAKYKLNVHNIDQDFENIAVATGLCSITVKPSDSNRCTVICYEHKKVTHTVTVKDGNLLIDCADQRKWYHRLLPRFQTPWIALCLPKAVYHTLALKCTTGHISVSSIRLNGPLCAESVTGKISLTDVTCKSLAVRGITGAVTLSDVVATDRIEVRRTTGKVLLHDCDAAALQIKVTTGSVQGRLLSNKIFSAKATTGKVELPEVQIGGRCEVRTVTGSIRFEIAPPANQ